MTLRKITDGRSARSVAGCFAWRAKSGFQFGDTRHQELDLLCQKQNLVDQLIAE